MSTLTNVKKRHHENNQEPENPPPPKPIPNPKPQRTFGKVLQQHHHHSSRSISKIVSSTFYSKPNPNERLWYPTNPSPNKKSRSKDYKPDDDDHQLIIPYGEDENARGCWPLVHDGDDKENSTTNQPHQPPRTLVTPDLNNSFTEKISNLNILTTSSPLLTPEPPSTPNEDNESWIESLDPDYPYITEILNHWNGLELSHKVNPNYMNKQKEVSYKMRTILVDWLVEVVEEYRIGDATLHRAVQFVDRFLSKLQISRSNLQLLGTTCLFIACKVEEIQPPDTSDLIYITDNTYDKNQLLRMECLVLSVLDFDLLTPTPHEFTTYFTNTLNLTPTAQEFSNYIIELTLLDGEKFLKFKASVIAMASCFAAIRCCGDTHKQASTLKEVLTRVRRLKVTVEYEQSVEEALSCVYVSLLSAASASNASNSVTSKYKVFQEQKYLVAAASLAATSSIPWF